MAAVAWDLEVGTELDRSEVHKRFGGSNQGGIASAPKSDSVLLFDTDAGRQFGYNYDGWRDDGSFHYTGAGQYGDQEFVRGNKVVMSSGRPLRVFEGIRKGRVRYLGEFKLDATAPYYIADAPDHDGEDRSVIVFRLWQLGTEPPTSTPTATETPTERTIPVEAHKTEKYTSNPKAGQTQAERREAELVKRYTNWLDAQDRKATSREIQLPGRSRSLYTDIFDESSGELIEAKGATSRNHVRLALGQILDYARFVKHNQLAILVPVRPADDLITLLASHGVNCIYEPSKDKFERIETTTKGPDTSIPQQQ